MKIELDKNSIKVSILNIPEESLSEAFHEFLGEKVTIEYKDMNKGLGEDLYIEEDLHEVLYTEEDKYPEEIKETVQNIADLMTMHDCCYFRIIKY